MPITKGQGEWFAKHHSEELDKYINQVVDENRRHPNKASLEDFYRAYFEKMLEEMDLILGILSKK